MQGKHIRTIPSDGPPRFYQNVQAKNKFDLCDLEWPEREVIGAKLHMGHREWPNMEKKY